LTLSSADTHGIAICTHIHTGYTHTGTHTKKEKRKSRKIRKIMKKEKEKVGKPPPKKKRWGIRKERKKGKKRLDEKKGEE